MRVIARDERGTVATAVVDGTPLGRLGLLATGRGLAYVRFGGDVGKLARTLEVAHPDDPRTAPDHLREALASLDRYLAGEMRRFHLPLDLRGRTPFQARVLEALREVGYGEVVTYGELARLIGAPEAPRAVGAAVGSNPLPIVIPCHRVIRGDRRLGGYGGGIARKIALLRLEGVEVEGFGEGSRVRAPS